MTLAACVSPPPDPTMPTVSAISVSPDPVPASTDGSYSFTVTFHYGDNANVESYTWVAGPAMVAGTIATPQHNGTTKLNVKLGTGAPVGTLDFVITITDAMQRMSDDGQGSVVLNAP